ncbi:MAG TPA: S53 family peptidase [Dictyobacter sp.]|nr:S53 family peptidase [Dictyobacter sp.]
MRKTISRKIWHIPGIVLALLIVMMASASHVSARETTHNSNIVANSSFTPHLIRTDLGVKMTTADLSASLKAGPADATTPPCLQSKTSPICYSPQQIQKAYDIQPLLDQGITGAGQTIVIVDDFQSPTLRTDLQYFDQLFGLNDPQLNIIAPYGLKQYDPNDEAAVSFAEEISLDVEWSHAIAPDATIDLVLGNPVDDTLSGQIDAIIQASAYAVQHNLGSTMSLSVGAGETCYTAAERQQWHQVFAQAQAKAISVLVSSGDSGAAADVCNAKGNVTIGQGVSYPASDPLVTAVGGTSLFASKDGTYINEITWNTNNLGGTGGGFSTLYAVPAYQKGVNGTTTKRGIPDVAYNADPATGVVFVTGALSPGSTFIGPIGGTSAGAPQWAAIVALENQYVGKRLGFLNTLLYKIGQTSNYTSEFNDIIQGDNTVVVPGVNGQALTIQGYYASNFWDAVTGWGTPDVDALTLALSQ